MDEIKSVLNRAVDLLEQDNRGVQLGCYSVALVGLSIAIRRVRPFSKFRKPSDVPNIFIKERKELTGVVERIEAKGGLLMINHKPLVAIPGLPGGHLPVKISGVRVSGLGLNWLQVIVVGNEVKFIPVAKGQDFVQCEVVLPQIQVKKANKKQLTNVNIGESLVKIGFGTVTTIEKPLPSDPTVLTYYKRLLKAENYAIRKRLGAKYYLKPTQSVLIAAAKSIRTLLRDFYRHIIQIPKMPAS